jgi:integrase
VDPRRADRPFREVVEAWRETWVNLEPKTRAGYESILRRHLLPEFGSRRVSAITPERVQAYVNRLATSKAPGTVSGIYRVLHNALNAAVRQRMLTVNPCTGVRLPRQVKQDHVYLTAAEVQKLADAITPHYRTLIYMAAYTGLRAGELGALRRRDLDLLRGTLHVRQALKDINSKHLPPDQKGLIFGSTKNHEHRVVSLPAFLKSMLAEHLTRAPLSLSGGAGPDALVFTTTQGHPIRHGLFYRRQFKPAVKAALPHYAPPNARTLRFHDLRHTCASLSIAAGAHPKLISARLGHSSIQITLDRYGHLFPSVEAALAEALDAAFTDAQAPPANVKQLRGENAVPGA